MTLYFSPVSPGIDPRLPNGPDFGYSSTSLFTGSRPLDCCIIPLVYNKPLFTPWTWSGDWFLYTLPNNNKDRNSIFYHIKCQFVLKYLHTLPTYNSHYSSTRHSNRITYSMFDILFMYNTSLNRTRTEISTFLKSLHQAPLSSPPQCDHQALSLAREPGTLPPSSDSLTPSGLTITSFTPDSIPWPHVVCTHPKFWQLEHYYILYFKSPTVYSFSIIYIFLTP